MSNGQNVTSNEQKVQPQQNPQVVMVELIRIFK